MSEHFFNEKTKTKQTPLKQQQKSPTQKNLNILHQIIKTSVHLKKIKMDSNNLACKWMSITKF